MVGDLADRTQRVAVDEKANEGCYAAAVVAQACSSAGGKIARTLAGTFVGEAPSGLDSFC